SHLKSLELEETREYILHRLDVVGWRGDPAFSQAVFPLVYKFSEGIPRRINLICSRLLLHCALEQRHRVEVADVREVIGELQDEHLA
ncbi:MAG TPA: general secretion pathway protein, partial [Halieaceae bacterium]|nr:general secretion pathway protein [Halieaceae bacterium]